MSSKSPVNGQLKDPYEVHGVVRQYLDATKLVQYNAVGINWMLEANQVEPAEWYRVYFSGSGDFLRLLSRIAPDAEECRSGGLQSDIQLYAAITVSWIGLQLSLRTWAFTLHL